VGCGPIGLFAIAVARACGAAAVYALEINDHRRKLAHAMHAEYVLNPAEDDVSAIIHQQTAGVGVDVVLEMSGHPDGMRLGFEILRTGGRVSLLGLPARPVEIDFARDIIFKGATVQGINGRKMYETWYQMEALLKAGKLDLAPVITHKLPMEKFAEGMDLLRSGEASKILLYPRQS
jgi:threonine 3-dehydrogenase